MNLKGRLQKLRTPAEELGLAQLRDFCAQLPGVTPIGEVGPRQEVSVVGEISSLRIVPRAGCPSLEATITDGTGTIIASWTGRRQIAGISPGRRLIVHGRANPCGPAGRMVVFNPSYELL
ncbi:MAG TPA: OB-fold nucleic acid binding domain-containing protein [Acidimicrobiales bacterium]|nr:OB-fold nucleic acid binding domain-containing protein [Acidimicrobiales bacterium]